MGFTIKRLGARMIGLLQGWEWGLYLKYVHPNDVGR